MLPGGIYKASCNWFDLPGPIVPQPTGACGMSYGCLGSAWELVLLLLQPLIPVWSGDNCEVSCIWSGSPGSFALQPWQPPEPVLLGRSYGVAGGGFSPQWGLIPPPLPPLLPYPKPTWPVGSSEGLAHQRSLLRGGCRYREQPDLPAGKLLPVCCGTDSAGGFLCSHGRSMTIPREDTGKNAKASIGRATARLGLKTQEQWLSPPLLTGIMPAERTHTGP